MYDVAHRVDARRDRRIVLFPLFQWHTICHVTMYKRKLCSFILTVIQVFIKGWTDWLFNEISIREIFFRWNVLHLKYSSVKSDFNKYPCVKYSSVGTMSFYWNVHKFRVFSWNIFPWNIMCSITHLIGMEVYSGSPKKFGKLSIDKVFIQWNIHSDKCPFRQLSIRWSIHSTECLFNKLSIRWSIHLVTNSYKFPLNQRHYWREY